MGAMDGERVGVEDDAACGWCWRVELEDGGGVQAVEHEW
jgi:hypothetical protein